jgi:hypothetical protein
LGVFFRRGFPNRFIAGVDQIDFRPDWEMSFAGRSYVSLNFR